MRDPRARELGTAVGDSSLVTEARMRPQPLISVRDVEASSRCYQRSLGCQSAHGGADYERLVDTDRLVLQLHMWGVEHHHRPIGDLSDKPYGNGVLWKPY